MWCVASVHLLVPPCGVCGEPAHARLVRYDGSLSPVCHACIAEHAAPKGRQRKVYWFWPASIMALLLGASLAFPVGAVLGKRSVRVPACPACVAPVCPKTPPVVVPTPPASTTPPADPVDPPYEDDPADYGVAALAGKLRPMRYPAAQEGEAKNAQRAVDALKRVSAREGAKEICRAQGGVGFDRGTLVVCKFPGVDAHGWADEAAVEGWRLKVDL